MPRFSSIPVKFLRPLLDEIERDFREWSKTASQGQTHYWNGLSGPVQIYFKAAGVDPSKKYAHFYSPERHTIATSYVWSTTELMNIAGEFRCFNSQLCPHARNLNFLLFACRWMSEARIRGRESFHRCAGCAPTRDYVEGSCWDNPRNLQQLLASNLRSRRISAQGLVLPGDCNRHSWPLQADSDRNLQFYHWPGLPQRNESNGWRRYRIDKKIYLS